MNQFPVIRLVLVAALSFFLTTFAHAQGVNAKIVEFCAQHLGEKVGNGECAVLASQALHHAGAKSHFKNNPEKGDYAWGKLLSVVDATAGGKPLVTGSLAEVMPGDIIQFRDAFFSHHKRTLTFHHHTAIVRAATQGGNDLAIYQQNFGGKKVSERTVLKLETLKKGWIRIYRPEPKDDAK